MIPAQVRCRGCNKGFTPCGLSHHISKTQNIRCRRVNNPPWARLGTPSIPRAVSRSPPSPNRIPEVTWDDESGDEYYRSTCDDLDGGPDLGEHSMGVDNSQGLEEPSIETPDPADVADADAFEELTGNVEPSSAMAIDHLHGDSFPDIPEGPGPQSNQTEAGTFEMGSTVIVDHFPAHTAGAPIPGLPQGSSIYNLHHAGLSDSDWAPFRSQQDWEVARWAKLCGATSSAVSNLLAIPEVVDTLGLSYNTVNKLNSIIDTKLPGRPPFQRKELVIGGEHLEFYWRDVLECIRSLYGDPKFAQDLAFVPERHYTCHARRIRIYNEMCTGDWWWGVQESLEAVQPGATIIPVIVSSDKTQLTLFRDKQAYPVYLTIGNIPKDIRRKPSRHAQLLVAYIPTTKLEGMSNKSARRRALANLFHGCMGHLLDPIVRHGETGVPMMSGDGVWRRCHPIFAIFIGDYPEQTLATCTYNGRCPKCSVNREDLGEYQTFPPRLQSSAMVTYRLAGGDDVHAFHLACRQAGLKPIYRPFWATLPFSNIFVSVTPDILHQLLQGMMKHIIKWIIKIYGAAAIDARCKAIPPHHKTPLFTKGIATLSRISGQEHKRMCAIILGIIVDLPIPGGLNSSRLVKAVRAVLDFLYVAQYTSHTNETLSRLQDSLAEFHINKGIFFDLRVRENFNIPKLHSLSHYESSIQLFGTTDNYNTEQSERLHIDMAKDAYRATNHKDEYSQMTIWLERREKVERHTEFINWRQQGTRCDPPLRTPIGPPRPPAQRVQIAQKPSVKAETVHDIIRMYGAVDFADALGDFIAGVLNELAPGRVPRYRGENIYLPFSRVPVHHTMKFTKSCSLGKTEIVDAVHARPEGSDSRGRIVPSRFDTILVKGRDQTGQGNNGPRIVQVRVIFQIPSAAIPKVFPSPETIVPTHLAYVEWFSPLSTSPDPRHMMHRVSRLTRRGRRCASVIPTDSILGSVHLIPRFGRVVPREWNSFTVLEECESFYVNPFNDVDTYLKFV